MALEDLNVLKKADLPWEAGLNNSKSLGQQSQVERGLLVRDFLSVMPASKIGKAKNCGTSHHLTSLRRCQSGAKQTSWTSWPTFRHPDIKTPHTSSYHLNSKHYKTHQLGS